MDFDFSLLLPIVFMFFWLFFVIMILRGVFKTGKGMVQLFQKGRMVDGKFVVGASDDLPPAVKQFLEAANEREEEESDVSEDAAAAPDIFSQLRKSSYPAQSNGPLSVTSPIMRNPTSSPLANQSPIGKEEGSSALLLTLLLLALAATFVAWYFLG